MDQEKFKFDKQKLKKGLYIALIIAGGLALAVLFFFLIFNFQAVANAFSSIIVILRPFIIGAIIAYILKSTCNGYEKLVTKLLLKFKKINKEKVPKRANLIAVVFTYITWIVIIGALLWVALPQVYDSIYNFVTDLIEDMPVYIETATAWIENFKSANPDLAPYVDKAGAAIQGWITNDLAPMLPEIGETILTGVIDLVNIVKDIAIGLVLSVFFLAGRKTFAKKTKLLVNCLFKGKHANAIIKEVKFADRMFGGFLEGKIIDSAIIGIIYYIALTLMDIKYAALLALICGVTNIIPFFGPFLGAIPSGFIILMSHGDEPLKLLYFIIFVCVVQFIDGNIIDPHIVGGNIQISPFCVIFAVLFFGGLWGFWGLLIGVPLFAVIYDIIKKIVYARLIKTGKKDILREHLNEFGRQKKKASANGAPVNTQQESVDDAGSVEDVVTPDEKNATPEKSLTKDSDASDEEAK